MDNILKYAYEFGAEADENGTNISEYYEDFCILTGVKKWLDIDPDLKAKIKGEFKKGRAANRAFFIG